MVSPGCELILPWKVYWINLEKRYDRRHHMEKLLCNTNNTRIKALDPTTMGDHFVIENKNMTEREKACLGSHLLAIRTYLETSQDPCAFIAEDDLTNPWQEYWHPYHYRILKGSAGPSGLEVLQLGTTTCEYQNHWLVPKKGWSSSSVIYLITRHGAMKLLDDLLGETKWQTQTQRQMPLTLDLSRWKRPVADFLIYERLNTYILPMFSYLDVLDSDTNPGNRDMIPSVKNQFDQAIDGYFRLWVQSQFLKVYISTVYTHFAKKFVELLAGAGGINIQLVETEGEADFVLVSHTNKDDTQLRKKYLYLSGESYCCGSKTNSSGNVWLDTVIRDTPYSLYMPYCMDSPYWLRDPRVVKTPILERKFKLAYCSSNYREMREKVFRAMFKASLEVNRDIRSNGDNTGTHALGLCCGGHEEARYSYPEIKGKAWYHKELVMAYGNYQFILAVENSCNKGYITEKIFNAYASGAIPVFYGDSETAKKLFNPKSFIDVSDFDSLEACASYIYQMSDIEIGLVTSEPVFLESSLLYRGENDQVNLDHHYWQELGEKFRWLLNNL